MEFLHQVTDDMSMWNFEQQLSLGTSDSLCQRSVSYWQAYLTLFREGGKIVPIAQESGLVLILNLILRTEMGVVTKDSHRGGILSQTLKEGR